MEKGNCGAAVALLGVCATVAVETASAAIEKVPLKTGCDEAL